MTDDPFAEPTDTDETLIRPRPGGRLPGMVAPPNAVARTDVPEVGVNVLVAAAAPLLAAVSRLGGQRGRAPDPDQLKRGMVEAVRQFEQRAVATGRDVRTLRAARYALCATIDDVVLNTPWGSTSSWAQQSLTSLFHNEIIGGNRFFEILEEMQRDLGRYSEVVELMYLCASLGFEGRYRVMPRGTAALAEMRDGVYRTVRQRRGEFERDLSPHWRGLQTGYRPLAQRVPLWVVALGTLSIACLIYLVLSFSLAAASDQPFQELASLPPAEPQPVRRQAVPAPPPTPSVDGTDPAAPTRPSLRQFLEPEVKAGLVQVLEDPQSITVRVLNRDMFASGSATLNQGHLPLLGRIGTALEAERGDVTVNGYTDNQPIHTVQFPSNWQLSQARADIVARTIAGHLSDAKRVHATGKGDTGPVAPNTTPDGRQQNRRTDIVLTKTAGFP